MRTRSYLVERPEKRQNSRLCRRLLGNAAYPYIAFQRKHQWSRVHARTNHPVFCSIVDRRICGQRICSRKNQACAEFGYDDLHDDLQFSVRKLPVLVPSDRLAAAVQPERPQHEC